MCAAEEHSCCAVLLVAALTSARRRPRCPASWAAISALARDACKRTAHLERFQQSERLLSAGLLLALKILAGWANHWIYHRAALLGPDGALVQSVAQNPICERQAQQAG